MTQQARTLASSYRALQLYYQNSGFTVICNGSSTAIWSLWAPQALAVTWTYRYTHTHALWGSNQWEGKVRCIIRTYTLFPAWVLSFYYFSLNIVGEMYMPHCVGGEGESEENFAALISSWTFTRILDQTQSPDCSKFFTCWAIFQAQGGLFFLFHSCYLH